jgi:protoheme IX farnesyltransferase
VIELLLVVTAPTMILASNGLPDLWLLIATLIGGAMSAGSAGAFNCYIDRDIDRIMKRTKGRPLVTGELTDREALVFAYALGIASIVWLGVFANWAAVTGSLDWAPFILFLIIFLWTPPHYWPLSMKYKDDYAAAGVPMLAVVRGRAQVGLQVILYAYATVAASLLLVPIAGMGLVYTAVALVTGVWFIAECHRLYGLAIRGVEVSPMRVFHGSIVYLSLLFLAVGIDPLLPF